MTRLETGQVMNLLTAAYPRYYAGIDEKRSKNALNMWATLFENDNILLVLAAVRAFIDSDEKGFPPVPGQIKAKMRLIVDPEELSEMEAWNMVARALKNGVYGAKEEFEKFPPILKRIVGCSSQLRDWSLMDSETVHSVVASNFQRSYKAISAQEREVAKLPEDVKALVSALRLERARMPELPAARETAAKPDRPADTERREKVPLASILERVEKMKQEAGYVPKEPERPRRSREEIIAILRGERAETA